MRGVGVSPADGTIVLCADRRRRRVPSALLLDPGRRLAREDDGRRRRCSTSSSGDAGRRTERSSRTRRMRGRRPTWRSGCATSRPVRRARSSARDVSLPARLVAGRHEAARRRLPQQQRHLDTPRRPRDGRASRELTPHDDEAVYCRGRGRRRFRLLPGHRRGSRVRRRSRSTTSRRTATSGSRSRRGRRGRRPSPRRARARVARQRGRLGGLRLRDLETGRTSRRPDFRTGRGRT